MGSLCDFSNIHLIPKCQHHLPATINTELLLPTERWGNRNEKDMYVHFVLIIAFVKRWSNDRRRVFKSGTFLYSETEHCTLLISCNTNFWAYLGQYWIYSKLAQHMQINSAISVHNSSCILINDVERGRNHTKQKHSLKCLITHSVGQSYFNKAMLNNGLYCV